MKCLIKNHKNTLHSYTVIQRATKREKSLESLIILPSA